MHMAMTTERHISTWQTAHRAVATAVAASLCEARDSDLSSGGAVIFIGGVMESDFHRLRRRKTDLALRIWFLRIHDHGLGRLHIYELVIDLFYGFQGKF
jgi:hypothetical protein